MHISKKREVGRLAKNARKDKQAAVEAEKAARELEELKKKLSAETAADMKILRALLDAEKQARGIEQAAEDYSVGMDWRLTESEREIDAKIRAKVREEVELDSAEAAKKSDEKIAAVKADVEKKREAILKRFEARRSEYADRVFKLVIGAADE